MTTPEGTIQRQIIDALEGLGHKVVRLNVGRRGRIRFGEVGMPDLWVLPGDGRIVFLEVKTEGKEPTKAQGAWHSDVWARGYVVRVVRSVEDALAAVSA